MSSTVCRQYVVYMFMYTCTHKNMYTNEQFTLHIYIHVCAALGANLVVLYYSNLLKRLNSAFIYIHHDKKELRGVVIRVTPRISNNMILIMGFPKWNSEVVIQ